MAGLTGGLGWVGRPTKRAGRGREVLLESQEGLGGQGKVGSPSRRARRGREALQKGAGRVGRPSWGAKKGRKAQQEGGWGWEAFPVGREESGVPPGVLGGFGSHLGGPGGVRSLPRRTGRGEEAHQVGQEGSGGPPGGLVGSLLSRAWRNGRSSRRVRSSWEALLKSRRGVESLLGCRD